jgi:hypothetical protein
MAGEEKSDAPAKKRVPSTTKPPLAASTGAYVPPSAAGATLVPVDERTVTLLFRDPSSVLPLFVHFLLFRSPLSAQPKDSTSASGSPLTVGAAGGGTASGSPTSTGSCSPVRAALVVHSFFLLS